MRLSKRNKFVCGSQALHAVLHECRQSAYKKALTVRHNVCLQQVMLAFVMSVRRVCCRHPAAWDAGRRPTSEVEAHLVNYKDFQA